MAQTYAAVPNVLYETFNEPIGQSWTQVIKPYHEQIVSTIRRFTTNIVILGTPFYSQRVDEASQNPVAGSNLAYTIHFYAAAAAHGSELRNRVSTALSNGVAVFGTEWGLCEAWGNGNLDYSAAQTWLDFFQQHHIADANWAVSDKDESCSALIPFASVSNWGSSSLTASGTWVRNSLRASAGLDNSDPVTTTGSDSDGSCSSASTNCMTTRCCNDPFLTCYEKNAQWASCRSTCTPGIDPTEAPEHQTPWTCAPVTRDACSSNTQNCQDSRCCQDPSMTCYEKNQYWAQCKATCTPGIDPNDPVEHRTPWSCANIDLSR